MLRSAVRASLPSQMGERSRTERGPSSHYKRGSAYVLLGVEDPPGQRRARPAPCRMLRAMSRPIVIVGAGSSGACSRTGSSDAATARCCCSRPAPTTCPPELPADLLDGRSQLDDRARLGLPAQAEPRGVRVPAAARARGRRLVGGEHLHRAARPARGLRRVGRRGPARVELARSACPRSSGSSTTSTLQSEYHGSDGPAAGAAAPARRARARCRRRSWRRATSSASPPARTATSPARPASVRTR